MQTSVCPGPCPKLFFLDKSTWQPGLFVLSSNPSCIPVLSPCKSVPTFGDRLLDNPYATSILLQMPFYCSSSNGALHMAYFSFRRLFACWPFYMDLALECKVGCWIKRTTQFLGKIDSDFVHKAGSTVLLSEKEHALAIHSQIQTVTFTRNLAWH